MVLGRFGKTPGMGAPTYAMNRGADETVVKEGD